MANRVPSLSEELIRERHAAAEAERAASPMATFDDRADRLVAAVAYRMQGDWKPVYAQAVNVGDG